MTMRACGWRRRWARFAIGDAVDPSTPLTAGQSALAARHAGLAKALARRFAASWPQYSDDLESDAMMGLVIAAGQWQARRGRFASFAAIVIRNRMIDRLRRNRTNPAPGELIEGVEAVKDWRPSDWFLAALAGRDAELVHALAFGDRTLCEIAEDWGISRATMSWYKRRALRRLRAAIGEVDDPDTRGAGPGGRRNRASAGRGGCGDGLVGSARGRGAGRVAGAIGTRGD